MSLSLKVLLNHIAKYLLLPSEAPLFWFTLNTSYNHFFHLSSSCPCCCCCRCHRRVVGIPIAANISTHRQQRWQRQGGGQGNSAVFHHKAVSGCVVIVAVVDASLLALALFFVAVTVAVSVAVAVSIATAAAPWMFLPLPL
jgi:hypothetical protein